MTTYHIVMYFRCPRFWLYCEHNIAESYFNLRQQIIQKKNYFPKMLLTSTPGKCSTWRGECKYWNLESWVSPLTFLKPHLGDDLTCMLNYEQANHTLTVGCSWSSSTGQVGDSYFQGLLNFASTPSHWCGACLSPSDYFFFLFSLSSSTLQLISDALEWWNKTMEINHRLNLQSCWGFTQTWWSEEDRNETLGHMVQTVWYLWAIFQNPIIG